MADESEIWDKTLNRSCSAQEQHIPRFYESTRIMALRFTTLSSRLFIRLAYLIRQTFPLRFQDVPASRKNIKQQIQPSTPKFMFDRQVAREFLEWNIKLCIWWSPPVVEPSNDMYRICKSSFSISQCLETSSSGTLNFSLKCSAVERILNFFIRFQQSFSAFWVNNSTVSVCCVRVFRSFLLFTCCWMGLACPCIQVFLFRCYQSVRGEVRGATSGVRLNRCRACIHFIGFNTEASNRNAW